MPRVATKVKSTRGARYECVKCSKKIVAGEEYHEWSFFRSSPRRQHASHGYPKQSQLTSSKMSSVYASIEDAEETIPKATEPSDIAEALQSVADSAREVADEYQEAVDAMGAAGESGTSAERVSELESFIDELDNAISEIESAEFEDEDEADAEPVEKKPTDRAKAIKAGLSKGAVKAIDKQIAEAKAVEEPKETKDEWLAGLRDQATDALGSLNI